MLKFFYLTILVLAFGDCLAQELPPIIRHTPENYHAGNQNWMISQDDRRFIYVANNEGLLEYNGAGWTKYRSPNQTILRSVKVVGDKIFTGCYMEFGYWKRNDLGVLIYRSLSGAIKDKILDDEQFWNILSYDKWIVFQSLNRIYIYDSTASTFRIVTPPDGILKAFKAAGGIYYQTTGGNLLEIENGSSKLIASKETLLSKRIVNIFERDGNVMLLTQSSGFFSLEGRSVKPVLQETQKWLDGNTIYSGGKLSGGGFALGSISNGIFILNPDGTLKHHITQTTGLGNNTVLSVFEDADQNLWLGLDNGITCLNVASGIKSYSDNTGLLGTVYASVIHQGNLYVGTNQGLFTKKTDSQGQFTLIPGTKGQVWSLFASRGSLLCGHDSGTFVISGADARKIFDASGTWKFEPDPENADRIIQGNYSGLGILEKTPDGWHFKSRIPGFSYSTKYFEISGREIFVSHEYKGVFRLKMASDLSKVVSFERLEYPGKGKHSAIEKFNGAILYAMKDGIFKFDAKQSKFVREPVLSKVFQQDDYTSGKMIVDQANRLWIFTRNSINYFTLGKFSSQPQLNVVPIPSTLTNSMPGYENISPIGNNNYLVGTTDGYYALRIDGLRTGSHKVWITSVTKNKANQLATHAPLAGEPEIRYAENNITIGYSVPEYNKYMIAVYRFRLEGMTDQWSAWSAKPSTSFKNLSFGDYTFKVQARVGNAASENTATYRFTILRPWYASIFAIFCYALAVMLAGWFIHKAYKAYYQKQKDKLIAENSRKLELKQLENEQELMKLRNQQLLQDVESKNRELAVSTMNLIKKNELLSLIKDDLKKTNDESKNIKTVISTINKNISEEDTWDLFKEAFNNADKDFLKKIKASHPALTPNDLRLCAYLRLNLSSKEIAPLLNISVRSVEIKRYRLRKKMDLPHEQGLVEYILAV